jgi:hypothetical protein
MNIRIHKNSQKKIRLVGFLSISLGLAFAGFGSQAETTQTEALMQVLIKKGIITQEEAVEIRSEVLTMTEQATPVPATVSKSSPEANYIPMPSKLKGLKLYGDARFRYQYENARSQSGNNNDRSRWRYRARFGTDYQFKESGYSVGVRLETGESNDSTNVNYGGFFDKSGDQLGIGLLYLRYKGEDWDLQLGKHKMPFMLSKAFWDSDLNPEGVSESYKNGNWTYTFGQYVIDEEKESKQTPSGPKVDDDFLFAAQSKWTNGEGLSIAPIILGTTGGVSTASESAAFKGENAIKDFDHMLIAALPVEYKFKSGGRSQSIFGTYGINLNGDDAINDPNSPFYAGVPGMSSENQFFNIGYKNGSAKKKGEWAWGVEYRYIEAASITPNLSDSDFGKNHTNQHGLVVSIKRAMTDFFTIGLTVIRTEQIDDTISSPVANSGDVDIVQFDASVKF